MSYIARILLYSVCPTASSGANISLKFFLKILVRFQTEKYHRTA